LQEWEAARMPANKNNSPRHSAIEAAHIQLLKAALEHSPHGVALESAGVIAYANAPYAHLHGYKSPQEILGKTAQEIANHHGKHGTKLSGRFETLRQEFRYGRRPAAINIVRDRREAVRLTEERFRALVENSSDAIFLLAKTGVILYASPAAEKILGYPPQELVGRSGFDFIHPDDVELTRSADLELSQKPGAVMRIEIRLRHKDGSWRWVDSVAVNRYSDPLIRARVINFRDITERKALQQQLRDSQKMEAVGRLVGGMAHDFNNLLTAITLYSDLLLESLPQGSRQRRYVDEVRMGAQRGATLVKQLLAFSRQQVLDPRVLSLNTVVAGMTDMLTRLIGEDVELITQLTEPLGHVHVDPMQMQQVIMNLAFNSRDAMPNGGQLILETADVELDSARPDSKPGRYVSLVVSDTGCGMDEQIRAHIFEPFFTTKEIGKGTGLGLPTVYGIVRQSGGSITVDSEPGKGTRVTILLPRVDAAAELLPPEFEGDRMPRGAETVLLVEDDTAVRSSVHHLLTECGYAVLQASCGDEALSLVARHNGPIDLLLSDLVMPGSSGRAVAKEVAKIHPEIRVLFISGYDQHANAGDEIIFPKPFTRSALAQKVRQVLDAPAPAGAAQIQS
jgi:PAS domain S-box-containing protein